MRTQAKHKILNDVYTLQFSIMVKIIFFGALKPKKDVTG